MLAADHFHADDTALSDALARHHPYLEALDSAENLHLLRQSNARSIYLNEAIVDHMRHIQQQNLHPDHLVTFALSHPSGDERFCKVDRRLLVSSSAYFKALLSGAFAERQKAEIKLEKVPYYAFKVLVHYLESGELQCHSFQKASIDDLLALSDCYDVKPFKLALIKHMEGKLRFEEGVGEMKDHAAAERSFMPLSDDANEELMAQLRLCKEFHLSNLCRKIDTFLCNAHYRNWKEGDLTKPLVIEFTRTIKYSLHSAQKLLLSHLLEGFKSETLADSQTFVYAVMKLHKKAQSHWPQIWTEASSAFVKHPGWFLNLWQMTREDGHEELAKELSDFCLRRENYDIALYSSPTPERTFALT
jgi:hypothetical protein